MGVHRVTDLEKFPVRVSRDEASCVQGKLKLSISISALVIYSVLCWLQNTTHNEWLMMKHCHIKLVTKEFKTFKNLDISQPLSQLVIINIKMGINKIWMQWDKTKHMFQFELFDYSWSWIIHSYLYLFIYSWIDRVIAIYYMCVFPPSPEQSPSEHFPLPFSPHYEL